MGSTGAWRIPAAYRYALEIDDIGFAWEFLRRNEAFQQTALRESPGPVVTPITDRQPRDDRTFLSRQDRPHRADRLARWGLHFRAEPASQRGRSRSPLLAASASRRSRLPCP